MELGDEGCDEAHDLTIGRQHKLLSKMEHGHASLIVTITRLGEINDPRGD